MEHNQYLNEILYLIDKAYTTKNIDKNHLEYIHLFVNDLESNNKSLHAVYKKIDDIVTNKLANDYITLFTTHFSLKPEVTESFKIKSTLFRDSISNQKDTVLQLVEDEGILQLVYLSNDNRYLIDCENQKLVLINEDKWNRVTNNFNQNLGKALDDNLYKLSNTILRDNTRKITIPYINNFNDLELDENEYIHFYSSIVNNPYDKNHHRFTFVMGFGKKEEHYNLRSPLNNTNRNYFDTFQLCPPGC